MLEAITITKEQTDALEKAMMSHPEMEKKVRSILRSVLTRARKELTQDTRAVVGSDPREAYRAVKRSVYKRVLGGSLSYLPPKKSAGSSSYRPARKLRPGQRGGNRCPRSSATDRIDSYYGADRGFILRWLNSGTKQRTSRYGNRGSISARHWFGNSSQARMEKASEEFERLIEEEIRNVLD